MLPARVKLWPPMRRDGASAAPPQRNHAIKTDQRANGSASAGRIVPVHAPKPTV